VRHTSPALFVPIDERTRSDPMIKFGPLYRCSAVHALTAPQAVTRLSAADQTLMLPFAAEKLSVFRSSASKEPFEADWLFG
jgi:hypothetical protein